MITIDRDIVILDTETLGLDRDAPIWEFAAIHLDCDTGEVAGMREFTIRHDPMRSLVPRTDWIDSLPETFQADYRSRYRPELAIDASDAAAAIQGITAGSIIAGSNPSFDMDRLEILLRAEGLTPGWYHHPIDIPSMVVGQIAYRYRRGFRTDLVTFKSDQLGQLVDVDSGDYPRHTALGDVRWCHAMGRAMVGGAQ